MASVFANQLQPYEENQSPSPEETNYNPYETTLARGFTTRSRKSSHGPSSPVKTVNDLHRQLSADPESPPPAWKRRSPGTPQHTRSTSTGSAAAGSRSNRSPSESPRANSVRRHPHPSLAMTATQIMPPPMPGMFLHESPNGSSTNLDELNLGLPNPAFRRRPGGGAGSNRSSITSSAELHGLTGDELWALDHEQEIVDMSNPSRSAAERPLDTVNRMSRKMDAGSNFRSGLPGEVIWPSANYTEDFAPPIKSKSTASLGMLGKKTSERRMSRRAKSRQASLDSPQAGADVKAKSTPVSPIVAKSHQPGGLHSAHSSSTSLTSQNPAYNKSSGNLSRPPSAYYSRDFLSSLAPREGGYAIAATMGNGLGAVGSMTVDERRRSGVFDDSKPKIMGSRAPLSKSAGMGRWSLDGGENFNRPYTTPSAATTSSNLSGPPLQPEVSPPLDDSPPALPAGAMNPAYQSTTPATPTAALTPASSNPTAPSPLGQHTSSQQTPVTLNTATIPPPPPIPQEAPAPELKEKKSKKQLRKEVKDAEKAEAVRVGRERAEAARAAALKKQHDKEAAIKAKADAKQKEKEEKARLKAEKKAAKGSFFGRKQSSASAPTPASVPKGTTAAKPNPPSAGPSVQKPAMPAQITSQPQAASTSQPFPKLNSNRSDYKVPVAAAVEAPRSNHRSMPLERAAPVNAPQQASPVDRPSFKNKRSLLGTIKKRFSVMGSDDVPVFPPNASARERSDSSIRSESPLTSSAQTPVETAALSSPVAESSRAPAPAVALSSPSRLEVEPNSTRSDVAQSSPAQAVHPDDTPLQQSTFTSVPVPSSLGNPLARALSQEGAGPSSSASPSSSIRRNRTSLIGPRPMPQNESRSRSTSIATSEQSHSHSHASPTLKSGYPFPADNNTNVTASPAERVAVPVTPSTSGESTQYSYPHSHMSTVTPITSSSDFGVDSESRKQSLGSDSHGLGHEHGNGPERESSKDSNETVHVSHPVLAP